MIRYGILCTASIVERYIQGIRNSKDGVVYAIASRTDEKAKQAAQRFGIDHWYGSYESLMQDENIDVVYIPTMNTLHYENAKMALGYHKNVVMEKPFVLDAKEAEELFSKLADIEEQHEAKLLKLLKNLKNNEVFNKSTIKMWECRNCGHIHIGLSVPYECPVCKHPRAYFEIKKENY